MQQASTVRWTFRVDGRGAFAALLAGVALVACASGSGQGPADAADTSAAADTATDDDHYLSYVTFEAPGHENLLLHWPERRMPLRVYLPPPPAGLFTAPDQVAEAVRRGVLAWEGAAGAGLPSFTFVDDPSDADIPLVWSGPSGDWFIAHCLWDVNLIQRRFGVARIDVSARRPDGSVALESQIEVVVSHEVGHALGFGGHSPEPGDVMFAGMTEANSGGLSTRDKETLRRLYEKPSGTRLVGARRKHDQS